MRQTTILAAAALGALALAGAALGQDADFPTALDVKSLTAWIGVHTSLPPQSIVSVGSNSVIGLRSATPDPAQPGVFRAQIWSEVIGRQAAAAGGYLSWSGDIDVDCANRRSKAVRVTNYSQRNLAGTPKELPGSTSWVTPTPGTQLYSVIASVCDPNYKRPLAPASSAQAPARPAATAPALAESQLAAPLPAAAPALQPAAPDPAPMQAAPAIAAEPSPSPAPADPKPATMPDRPSALAAAAPTERVYARPPVAATPPGPEASKAAAAPRRGRAPVVVQVAAAAAAPQARRELANVQSRFAAAAGLDAAVVEAQVSGRTVYRAVLSGFESRAQAVELCDALQARGQACFLRPAR